METYERGMKIVNRQSLADYRGWIVLLQNQHTMQTVICKLRAARHQQMSPYSLI